MEVTDEMITKVVNYFNTTGSTTPDDRVWLSGAIKPIIELHEANKQKPEPVGYAYPSQYAEALENEGCFMVFVVPVTNLDTGEESSLPLYTAPPTREPLSEVEILKLALRDCYPIQFVDRSYGITLDKVTVVDFARLIEQAHGIGVSDE